MSNYETQEKLNARAAQNRENAEQAAVTESAVRRAKTRRKVTLKLIIRLGVAVGASALILLLGWLGLIAPALAFFCIAAILIWASVWFGAWLQLMACMKGRAIS